ncbi:MAG: hypothetical protein A2289_09665 [Deltaproteobacteria bacterium RIFOXYA12_FULL_58_15]|nr:MAG: hypothetical protein A2289_09665 [Deltaproteobacteria bacterium RIFOXYA12_FULL_58_15]OGR13692.1 MAG: hypothetical protein A2341_21240 [Deltaproteobacteria bacterium RIFOXYB12_FULL_58_9]
MRLRRIQKAVLGLPSYIALPEDARAEGTARTATTDQTPTDIPALSLTPSPILRREGDPE